MTDEERARLDEIGLRTRLTIEGVHQMDPCIGDGGPLARERVILAALEEATAPLRAENERLREVVATLERKLTDARATF